jgi:hypothetical protein
MNWNFDDFLAKTEEKPQDAKIVPLHKKSSKQWMYIAASIVLIAGWYCSLKIIKPHHLMKLLKQNKKTIENQNIAKIDNIASNSTKTIEKLTEKEDVVEKILPKKGD